MSSDIDFTLEAKTRHDVGKGASRRLRREKKVPAVVYGGKDEARSLTLSHDEVYRKLQFEAFYSHILTLKVDGNSRQRAILRDLQRHPYKPIITHMDFLRVVEDQAINVRVPLHFTNEEECVGVRMNGGEISHLESEVEVSCLPKHLPEYIEVDMSELDVGATVHLSDLQVPEGVTIVALAQGEEYDGAIASVHMPRVVTEEEEEPVEGEEAVPEAAEAEEAGEAEGESGEEASGEGEEE